MEAIRIYLTLFATSIKARMEYKASFLFYIFAILSFYVAQIGLLFVLLNRFQQIKGWTMGEMVFFIFPSRICIWIYKSDFFATD